jgi:hypothetical protein
MSDNKETEGEGFIIQDKRSSQLSEDEAVSADEQETKEPKEQTETTAKEQGEAFQIDFSTFTLSLTSSAFIGLGDMPDPATGKKEVNLPAVQQTIDMLTMLRDKTKGNLTEEENKLLEQLIYELQVKYVSKVKK